MDIDTEELANFLVKFGTQYALQIAGAVVILVIGFILARWVGRIVGDILERKGINLTLRKFISNMTRVAVMIAVVLMAMSKFGLSIQPFVAALGAMAFGASFALAGPLANYGAGLVIIITRPFVIGNTVTVGDHAGVVEEIKLSYTMLETEDGEKIMIPNKHIVGEVLINSFEYKLVEGSVGISYADDPAGACATIEAAIRGIDGVSKKSEPHVGIEAFAESSINIGYRYWVPTNRYYELCYAANLAVYQALRDAGVTIPFPQREVSLVRESAA